MPFLPNWKMFAGAAGSPIGRKLAPCPARSNNLMARLICLARYSVGKVEESWSHAAAAKHAKMRDAHPGWNVFG